MTKRNWHDLTNDEKLERLTSVLTIAGSNTKFRDRCLVSPHSAKEAIGEVGGIEFPPDFKVQFVTPEEKLKSLILTIPDFIPPQNGVAEVRHAEDHIDCTYVIWHS